MKHFISFFMLLLPLLSFGQDKTHELEINLAEMCQQGEYPAEQLPGPCISEGETPPFVKMILFSRNFSQAVSPDPCLTIKQLSKESLAPIEIIKKDEDGDTWKIKFFFGFTRTSYSPTDMKLNSSRVDVVIKDFEFDERTSAHFYNPLKWEKPQNALQWIDEPTNTFAFSLEKGKDAFYLTAFHPKFLKKQYQTKHVTGTVDSVAVDGKMPINEPFDGYNNQVGEMYLVRFENTHRQMDWQLGYGRKLEIFDNKKAGKLIYIPRVDVGVTSGQNYSVYTKKGEYWEYDGVPDKHRIQGLNASVGHRLEYEKKDVTLFVDQKVTASKLKHGFMDGEASYQMLYSPVTFGVGFNIYRDR
jgi:hypothetical protein